MDVALPHDPLDAALADAAPPQSAGARPVLPLWSGLFTRSPLPPFATGLGVSAVLTLAFLLFDAVDGNLHALLDGSVPWWAHVELRSALTNAVLFGVLLVVYRVEEIGVRHDLERLRPELRGREDAERLALREARAVAPTRMRIAGGVGAGVVASVVPALYLDPSRFLRLETWLLPSVQFDLAVGAAFGWALGRILYAGVRQDRVFARLSAHVERIELLDLAPLRPFARRGLRRSARWLLLASLSIPIFADAGLAAWPALWLAAILGFAGFSFVLPIRGIVRRIRQEKDTELARVRADIRAERDRLRGEGGERQGGVLADLIAYEDRIAEARVWPVDTGILTRLGVFLLLPLGSWLGGAFVERAVDLWLP